MALSVFFAPRFRALDANGNPMAGAILKFFEAGTTTPLAVYSDVDGTTPIGVTATADAGGLFAEMFMLAQAYKVELYTSASVLVWSADNFFPPQPASSANVDITATAGVTFAAGDAAYMSDGSGGLNAGQMYKADADLEYASYAPMIYFASAAIAAGASGLFRGEGTVTGLAGLTPGARYYLSGTAGAIASTAGAFTRFVGQAKSTTELAIATNPPLLPDVDALLQSLCNGRLTLTSGTPVTTADVTAATTLYFTPYQGERIGAYTGSRWVAMTFAEMSIAVPAAASQVYDVFYDYNDGVPALSLTAWTNDTTRATALTTQNGVYVKTGDTQQRYLGSFRTTAVSGQTEDSYTKRLVSNYYNRVERPMRVMEPANTWSYNTATWRQANANTANQIEFVIGVAEVVMEAQVRAIAEGSARAAATVAVGLDSITAPTSGNIGVGSQTTIGAFYPLGAAFRTYPSVGYHYAAWLERGDGGGATVTWYGDNNTPTLLQSGMDGSVWG